MRQQEAFEAELVNGMGEMRFKVGIFKDCPK